MTDGNWWNEYLALPGGQTTDSVSPEAREEELELEEYWLRRYHEITGHSGRWDSTDSVLRRVGWVIPRALRSLLGVAQVIAIWASYAALIALVLFLIYLIIAVITYQFNVAVFLN